RIVCDLDAGGAKSQKVVPIPRGVKLAVDPSSGGNLPEQTRVGQKSTLYFFDPTTLTLVRLDSSVVRAETRTLGGKKRRVFLVRNQDTLTGASEAWVDEQGKLLENNAPALGLRLVREDVPGLDTARSYEPPRDFAVATSVRTTVKLPQARTTRVLKLRISGIPDRSLLLRDPRQQIAEETETNGKLTATYRIEARELPAVCLPAAAPGSTGPGLGDAPYLGLEQESIRKTAREIAEQETNRGVLARRIRAWVKAHMTKPTNIGAPRSAAEIMATREGVCRDYATLFAALARAVGVPTRLCTGLVYFQEGFFYHAWVECQLTEGDAGWFAFDPTLSDDFVDATHVKFGQGDPTEMYAAVRVVGQIQAEILEYR
ncbi:MAG: transglutaminase domain-containing protein, partial [Armatimonadetes bacterium]|nr:transglutaminase domain-containing protein [Armatimonadota bacterium]